MPTTKIMYHIDKRSLKLKDNQWERLHSNIAEHASAIAIIEDIESKWNKKDWYEYRIIREVVTTEVVYLIQLW